MIRRRPSETDYDAMVRSMLPRPERERAMGQGAKTLAWSCSFGGIVKITTDANKTTSYGRARQWNGYYLRVDSVVDGDDFVTSEGAGEYALDDDNNRIPLYRVHEPIEIETDPNGREIRVYRRNYSSTGLHPLTGERCRGGGIGRVGVFDR